MSTLWVDTIDWRQMMQIFCCWRMIASQQSEQVEKWPHGRKIIALGWAKQTTQVLASTNCSICDLTCRWD